MLSAVLGRLPLIILLLLVVVVVVLARAIAIALLISCLTAEFFQVEPAPHHRH